ncbi:7371_t:CDS:1, partial [Dentiscutata erythropus]
QNKEKKMFNLLNRMPVLRIKDLEKNMLNCIDIFQKHVQTKTKDQVIKNQIKEVRKQCLEFHQFAEKSIKHNEILSNYIIEFQSIIKVIKNKPIPDEEMIEKLELLLSATEKKRSIKRIMQPNLQNYS